MSANLTRVLRSAAGQPPNVEVVPLTEADEQATNRNPSLVSDAIFNEALGEYCHR
jgi:hypothetical protein